MLSKFHFKLSKNYYLQHLDEGYTFYKFILFK